MGKEQKEMLLTISIIILAVTFAAIAYGIICRIEENACKYGTTAKWNYLFWEYRFQTVREDVRK